MQTVDVVVVGGGLTGLAAAAYLARAGKRVLLFEKARELGGRAITFTKGDFHFNLGPHALYKGGRGIKILRELGVQFTGKSPGSSGGYAIDRGALHTLPVGFLSLLTTGLLRWPEKLELARLLGAIPKLDPQMFAELTVQDWCEQTIRSPQVRQFLRAIFRLTSYADAPEHQSASVALSQAQLALARNVLYLNGGWQTLVDGLRSVADSAGVMIETGQRIVAVTHDAAVRGVRLTDGSSVSVAAVVVTGSPEDAAALLADENTSLHRWAQTAIPVKAACLDIGLSRLPRTGALFALGIDRPFYFSVHSAVAKLGPADGAVIHAAKYLNPMRVTDAKTDEKELEQLCDLVQPGWREIVVTRRFLPHLTVCHALHTAEKDGFSGSLGPAVPGIDNLYVAGDWVGAEGLLADASLASAKRAAECILQSGKEERIAA